MKLPRQLAPAVLAGALLLTTAGCDQEPPAPVSPTTSMVAVVEASTDDRCFMPLTQERLNQLAPLAVAQPGTGQNVCVIEKTNGGYRQQFYNEWDGFRWFWYYALLKRTAATSVFEMGVIAEPTELQFWTLEALMLVDKYGGVYSPRERDKTGKWLNRRVDQPFQITQIRHGAAPPVAPNSSATPPPPPPNYPKPLPQPQNGSGVVGREAEKRNTPPPVRQTPPQPKPQTQVPAPKPKR